MITLAGNLPYAYKDISINDLSENVRGEFESEVADGNFLRGGKSLILTGPLSDHAARQWIACLLLGGFNAYRATPVEIVRRAAGLPILGDDDNRASEFINAETMFIDDFFEHPSWGEDNAQLFTWFVREQYRNGVVLLIATEHKEKANLNVHGSAIGDMIENNFEVINGTGGKENKQTRRKIGKSNR